MLTRTAVTQQTVRVEIWRIVRSQSPTYQYVVRSCKQRITSEAEVIKSYYLQLNTLRTGDADLRFYITTVQDG